LRWRRWPRSAAPGSSGSTFAIKTGASLAVAGCAALIGYGFIATLQPDQNFGRVLAAYGGVFVAGSLAWGTAFDGFEPDRYDLIGAGICLMGVAVVMYTPR
jgi:small multidrug resistance family-3 protein